MKKIIAFVMLLTASIYCSAQVVPIEDHKLYKERKIEIPDGTYFKDVNKLLDKYCGTWMGVLNNLSFEFIVEKFTKTSGIRPLKYDILLMRYKIMDSSGVIIENTTSLSNSNKLVIKGNYIDNYYVLSYQGRNSNCGQNGNVYISVFGNQNEKMQLFLYPDGNIIDCTTGPAEQLLPTEAITLTRQ